MYIEQTAGERKKGNNHHPKRPEEANGTEKKKNSLDRRIYRPIVF
jgi:hypothetical protein